MPNQRSNPQTTPRTASPRDLRWHLAAFDDLRPRELYAILALRQMVFIVEQACIFPDADGADPRAWHLWATGPAGCVQACARLFAPGVSGPEARIGRVVTAPAVRGLGLGRALMHRAMEEVDRRFGPGPIRVAAQAHLVRFYGTLGFEPVGSPYDEDGIPHQDMLRPAPTSPSTHEAPAT